MLTAITDTVQLTRQQHVSTMGWKLMEGCGCSRMCLLSCKAPTCGSRP